MKQVFAFLAVAAALAFTVYLAFWKSNPYTSANPERRAHFKHVSVPLQAGTHFKISAGAFSCCTHNSPGWTYPKGLDIEVCESAALRRAAREATGAYEREHVTPYIWRRPQRYPAAILECERDLGTDRWTVDHPADLDLVRAVYERLSEPFGWREVLALLESDPTLRGLNAAHRAAQT